MFLATIAAERATAFPLAPTMLQMLCEHPDWDATDLSSVRCVAYGGSPVLERVAKAGSTAASRCCRATE